MEHALPAQVESCAAASWCPVSICYKADATALQEMRCSATGFLEKRDYIIYHSCHTLYHVLGAGFLVSQNIKLVVINFENIIEWQCALHFAGKFLNDSPINVHTLQRDIQSRRKIRQRNEHSRNNNRIILGEYGKESVISLYVGIYS